MTAPALVKQAAIARAMREAKKHGAKKIHIGADGSIDIILGDEQMEDSFTPSEQDPPVRRAMFEPRPKRKVVL
jgi:hypothetical protein